MKTPMTPTTETPIEKWTVAIEGGNLIVSENGEPVARALGKDNQEAARRARKIAAFSEMLEALKDAEDALSLLKLDHPTLGYTGSLERIRTAIAKASL